MDLGPVIKELITNMRFKKTTVTCVALCRVGESNLGAETLILPAKEFYISDVIKMNEEQMFE